MIYESYPWKQDLLRRKRLILKYNRAGLLNEDSDQAYTVIEKAVFYSAFIIRKLIDCKCKVSDEVDSFKFTLSGISPKKEIDMLHRWPDEGRYNWDHERSYTKSGNEICNWLIHSYIFFFGYDKSGKIDSFYVSSERDKNKLLYRIELKDWLSYMEFVSSDEIGSLHMKVDAKKQDYVCTKKERGWNREV